MKYYIAGPMAGRPDANRDEFAMMARLLAQHGHEVVNPHDVQPDEHDGPCPDGYSAGQGGHNAPCYMRSDLRAMLDCDAVMLLPGWRESEGARAEYFVALVAGLRIVEDETGSVLTPPQPSLQVMEAFGLEWEYDFHTVEEESFDEVGARVIDEVTFRRASTAWFRTARAES